MADWNIGRIKPGTICGVDFRCFRWPDFPAEFRAKNFDPDMKFHIRQQGELIEAVADGFGAGPFNGIPGEYFNGSLYLYAPNTD